jgi:hypothetical protein
VSHELYLPDDDGDHPPLDVQREVLVASDAVGSPVLSELSEAVVLAGEEHLLELPKGQAAVLVVVEELDEAVELALCDCVNLVVSEEIVELVAGHFLVRVSVYALEGHAGREVADLGQSLS